MPSLVSIIIPTYNRAHLIGQTIDSIIKQTFKSWEGIVVDDGSSDHTEELLEFYCARDSRIQYHQRPHYKPKGANACRNHGFELSNGNYIIWFDSDDLMDEQYLARKIQLFSQDKNLDVVVSRAGKFFDCNNYAEPAYDQNNYGNIDPMNYILHKNFWVTSDAMFRKELVDGLKFNEELLSGQEYNLFTKIILARRPFVFYIDEVLVLKRIHSLSIQAVQSTNKSLYFKNKFKIYWYTYKESKKYFHKAEVVLLNNFFLNHITTFSFRLAARRETIKDYFQINYELLIIRGLIKTFFFNLSILSAYLTKKGFILLRLAQS